MNSLQEQIEELGVRDVSEAEGYVVCTNKPKAGRIMAWVPLHQVRVKKLNLFHRTFSECVAMRPDDVVFDISDYHPKSPCIITFEAPKEDFLVLFKSFLLYLGQARLLSSPIVCCKFNHLH